MKRLTEGVALAEDVVWAAARVKAAIATAADAWKERILNGEREYGGRCESRTGCLVKN